eukprot:SAG31_NODE_1739_length_7396_cov_3.063177_1_plen_75_part_00
MMDEYMAHRPSPGKYCQVPDLVVRMKRRTGTRAIGRAPRRRRNWKSEFGSESPAHQRSVESNHSGLGRVHGYIW